jgi:hypothetical protein
MKLPPGDPSIVGHARRVSSRFSAGPVAGTADIDPRGCVMRLRDDLRRRLIFPCVNLVFAPSIRDNPLVRGLVAQAPSA